MGMFLALFLLFVPLLNEKFDKMTRVARAIKEDRASFVLVGTGTAFTFLLAYVVTRSLNDLKLNVSKVHHRYLSLDTGWLQERKEGPPCQPW
jgi:hypothetical protein